MNHLKNVRQWFADHWVMPTPAELIAEELIQAQRTKLRHQSAQEYHTAIVAYNVARIKRHQSAMEYHTAIVAYNVARIKRLEQLTAKQEVVE